MILVDTSAWIHLLRPSGDAAVRLRVERALQAGEACWCSMVRIELWNGAGGNREKKVLRDFERFLPDLPISQEVWDDAVELARSARASAVTVPASDVLIAACARYHGAALEAADSDFDLLRTLENRG
jgi:predicted nucleic acid-binding protein